ncbi:MAG: 4Fe-4S binding protein, partial [Terriglobia bacterium]
MLDRSAKAYPLFDDGPTASSARCMRRLYKNSKCSLCVENCPSQAVSLEGPVSLIAERCTNCGVCVGLCPSGVFEPLKEDTSVLLHDIDRCLDGCNELGWACSPLLRDEGRSYSRVVEVPCLARADLSLLLSAVARGARTLYLNTAKCAECVLLEAREPIHKSIENANGIMVALGRDTRVVAVYGFPVPIKRERARYGRLGRGESMSRRAFLSGLRKTTLTSSVRRENSETEQRPLRELIRSSWSSSNRELLLDSLRALGPAPRGASLPKSAPFGQVEINERCDFCGLCALTCPSRALVKAGGAEPGLDFTAALCLGCGLCQEICPEDALVLWDRADADAVMSGESNRPIGFTLEDCEFIGPAGPRRHGLELSMPGGASSNTGGLEELGAPEATEFNRSSKAIGTRSGGSKPLSTD